MDKNTICPVQENNRDRNKLILCFCVEEKWIKKPKQVSCSSFPFPAEHLSCEQIPSSLFSKPGKAFQDKSKQSSGLAPCSRSWAQEDDLESTEVSPCPAGSAQVGLPQLLRLRSASCEWLSHAAPPSALREWDNPDLNVPCRHQSSSSCYSLYF